VGSSSMRAIPGSKACRRHQSVLHHLHLAGRWTDNVEQALAVFPVTFRNAVNMCRSVIYASQFSQHCQSILHLGRLSAGLTRRSAVTVPLFPLDTHGDFNAPMFDSPMPCACDLGSRNHLIPI